MAAVGASVGPAAGKRFNFSPRVIPFQPSPALTASEASFGTGTATTTPRTVSADMLVSPMCTTAAGTPGLNATARPFVPKELHLPERAEESQRKGGVKLEALLAMRGSPAEVSLCDSLPFVVVGSKGAGWAERAARTLEAELAEAKGQPAQARTTLAFLRSANVPKPAAEAPEVQDSTAAHELEGFTMGPSRATALASA
eukprot:TRINITY_DN2209_c0_g1_i3.p1 TRINITY_DN2209_c0_g1~~TRINITY_DN2209_c0_g1_i3.p1  ORF type:complete len:230 (+),score=71.55 TRINITY_DN2209_c0_g1_i3:95-691(+)